MLSFDLLRMSPQITLLVLTYGISPTTQSKPNRFGLPPNNDTLPHSRHFSHVTRRIHPLRARNASTCTVSLISSTRRSIEYSIPIWTRLTTLACSSLISLSRRSNEQSHPRNRLARCLTRTTQTANERHPANQHILRQILPSQDPACTMLCRDEALCE